MTGAELVVRDDACERAMYLPALTSGGALAGGRGEQRVRCAHAVAIGDHDACVDRGLERIRPCQGLQLFSSGLRAERNSEEQAAEYARQAGAASYRTEIRKPHILAGTPEQVRRELDALHARFGIAEFVIDTPTALTSRRLASLTLLAGERPALAA